MININVWSQSSVDIEDKNYQLNSKGDMVIFLKDFLDKVFYGGETICLESVTFNSEQGKAHFTEINRWK